MTRKRLKTRSALLIVFLVTLVTLAIIFVLVRQPAWYFDLRPYSDRKSSYSPGNSTNDSLLIIDAREWALPAIIVVVSLSGMAVWRVLLKANR